ncbi:MAG: restriction endonuclease subunit S [Candidatus Dechloromonas phosphoritropha]|jgi:type I restriction enzyme S subunit|nr:restriction endonuclease subunit S [Candidatus Dechloromonas phosphoritropha]MBP6707864.1 restriction endonuclease subunit S [Accumulibacter sp.]MBP9227420.1 restriction endonuclease subunit S [Azonexus sp.]
MTARLPEHLDLIAGAPDDIRKLRGLILELAVRGKLVPQDPHDEPASELLKRISKERASLEAKAAGKKWKATPFCGNETGGSFELPDGWLWVRFEAIAQHNSGKTLDRGRNSGEPRPYITTSNLYWGRFELDSVRQMLIKADELERCTARRNDLLICEGGEAGRAAVWPHDYEICFQNHVHRARFFGGIDPYFAYRFFEKLNASGEIDQYRKGVGISNMSGKALASIPFPVAPLAEQHRIVAKVDELMALCDRLEAEQMDAESAHARLVETLLGTLTQSTDAADLAANWQRLAKHFATLFTTEASIDALKQTILQLAVMGKLVPQDPNDEPASELLKRIAKERARLEAEGTCKKSKPVSPVGPDEQPFEVPEGWKWIRFAHLEPQYQNGESSRGAGAGTEIVVLRLADISNGAISFSNTRSITLPESSIEKYRLLKNDVLIIRVNGSVEIVGRLILCNENLAAIYCDHFIRVRIRETSVSHRYLRLIGDVLVTRSQIQRLFITTAGQKTVNQGHVGGLKIPLPPLAEQHRIVAKVDELLALYDRLKADLAESRAQQERLAATLIESALRAA